MVINKLLLEIDPTFIQLSMESAVRYIDNGALELLSD